MMNPTQQPQQAAAGPAQPGQAGGQQAQLQQQLMQMGHEQLVNLTIQLLTRLRQIEGQRQVQGGQQQPPRQPMR